MAIARNTTCKFCGLVYDDMRTGLTYTCIYSMLWSNDDDTSTWVYKRRHTILGLWHSIKSRQWYDHLDNCEAIESERTDLEEAMAEREAIIAAETMPDVASEVPLIEGVPF